MWDHPGTWERVTSNISHVPFELLKNQETKGGGKDKALCWLTFDSNNKYLGFFINYKMEKNSKVLQQSARKFNNIIIPKNYH
jgi:hypothetical protein